MGHQTVTQTDSQAGKYIAEIIEELTQHQKESLWRYLSDRDVYSRLMRVLESNAITLESPSAQVNLFGPNELISLKELLDVLFQKHD